MNHSLPGSSVHRILQAWILEWITMPFSRGSSQPRNWTCIYYVSHVGRWFFTTSSTWEVPLTSGSLLHWQAVSLPLSHLGSPKIFLYLPSKFLVTSAWTSVLCGMHFVLVQWEKHCVLFWDWPMKETGCLQQRTDMSSWSTGHWCYVERPVSIRSLVIDYPWITTSAPLLLFINFSSSR